MTDRVREVSRSEALLFECIADDSVPRPALMEWGARLSWRKGAGKGAKLVFGRPAAREFLAGVGLVDRHYAAFAWRRLARPA